MSTLADELLQDFEDSGSENGEREEEDEGDDTAAIMGLPGGDLPMDDTDLLSSDDEADQNMSDVKFNGEDQIEKNSKTSDLRTATSLVKTLDSVLEVSFVTPSNPFLHLLAALCAWTAETKIQHYLHLSSLVTLLRKIQQP